MAFAPGDEVHVAALGTGVVREVRNGRRYLIELKGRSIVATERQLTPAAGPRRGAAQAPQPRAAEILPARSHVPTSLDLHGMTSETAVAAVDAFLNDALLAGHAEVQLIHGRGGGRIRAVVGARLKEVPAVRAFRLDPDNPGVTIVTL